jgi:hypothetical protein
LEIASVGSSSDSVLATSAHWPSAFVACSTTLPASSTPPARKRLFSAAPKNFGGSSIASGTDQRK